MTTAFPPRCASKFRAQSLLAQGGFGSVHAAVQIALDRPVVVKLLHEVARDDAEQVERFRVEARVTAALRHPHIVVVLDHDVDDEVPWIAFERLPGPDVRALAQAGALPVAEAALIAQQVAGALAAAHAQGVLHRDIKPENVLRSSERAYKVTDFGIAKWAGGGVRTADGVILGTPAYISPEQARGEPAGPASDVYALGVMLFEMLCGRPPFVREHPMQLLTDHVQTPPPRAAELNAAVPPPLDALVAAMLDKDPARRATLATVEERLPPFTRPAGEGGSPPAPGAAGRSSGATRPMSRAGSGRAARTTASRAPVPGVAPGGAALGATGVPVRAVAVGAVAVVAAVAVAALALKGPHSPAGPPDPSPAGSLARSAGPPSASAARPFALAVSMIPKITTVPDAEGNQLRKIEEDRDLRGRQLDMQQAYRFAQYRIDRLVDWSGGLEYAKHLLYESEHPAVGHRAGRPLDAAQRCELSLLALEARLVRADRPSEKQWEPERVCARARIAAELSVLEVGAARQSGRAKWLRASIVRRLRDGDARPAAGAGTKGAVDQTAMQDREIELLEQAAGLRPLDDGSFAQPCVHLHLYGDLAYLYLMRDRVECLEAALEMQRVAAAASIAPVAHGAHVVRLSQILLRLGRPAEARDELLKLPVRYLPEHWWHLARVEAFAQNGQLAEMFEALAVGLDHVPVAGSRDWLRERRDAMLVKACARFEKLSEAEVAERVAKAAARPDFDGGARDLIRDWARDRRWHRVVIELARAPLLAVHGRPPTPAELAQLVDEVRWLAADHDLARLAELENAAVPCLGRSPLAWAIRAADGNKIHDSRIVEAIVRAHPELAQLPGEPPAVRPALAVLLAYQSLRAAGAGAGRLAMVEAELGDRLGAVSADHAAFASVRWLRVPLCELTGRVWRSAPSTMAHDLCNELTTMLARDDPAALDALLARVPEHVPARVVLSERRRDQHDWAAAFALLDAAPASVRDDPELARTRGVTEILSGRTLDGVSRLRRVDPQARDWLVQYWLGIGEMDRKDLPAAEACLRRALREDHTQACRSALADCVLRQGRAAEALALAEEAARGEPANPVPRGLADRARAALATPR